MSGKGKYSHIVSLVGIDEETIKAFSKANLRRYFRVLLWTESHICALCNKEIDRFENSTIDHIVPRAMGGRTRLLNVQLAHPKCNGRKGKKMPNYVNPKAFIPVTSRTPR